MRGLAVVLGVAIISLVAGVPGASAQIIPLPPIVPPPEDPSPPQPPPDDGGQPTPPPATTPGAVSTAPGTFGDGVNAARTGHVADDSLVPPLVKRWEFIGRPRSLAAADGRLFVAYEERWAAVDLATGKELWSVPIRGTEEETYDAGRLIVRSGQELIALDAATGATLWRVPMSDDRSRDPVAAGGHVYVVVAGTLHALDAANGATLWTASVPSTGGPAVDDERVYVLGSCGEARALARRDGAVVWRRPAEYCPASGEQTARLANGRLYHAAGYVLDPLTGAEIARNAGGGQLFFDGRVVMRPEIDLRAADASSWAPAWTHKERLDAPIVVGHDVYGLDFVSQGSPPWLRALDGETGAVLWEERLPGDIISNGGTGGGWRSAAAPGVLVVSAVNRVTAWESYFKPDPAGIALGYDRAEFAAGRRVYLAGLLGTSLRGPRPPVIVERAGWRRGAFRRLVQVPTALDGGFGGSATLTRNARLRVTSGGARSNVINVYAWPVVRLGKARAAGRTRITLGATVRSPGAQLAGRSFSIYLDRRGAKRLTRIATGRLRAAGRGGRFRSTLTFRPLRRVKKTDAILFCVRGQLDLDLGRPSNLLRQCGAGSVRRG